MSNVELWVAVLVGLAAVTRTVVWLMRKSRGRRARKRIGRAKQTAVTGEDSTVIQVQGENNRVRH